MWRMRATQRRHCAVVDAVADIVVAVVVVVVAVDVFVLLLVLVGIVTPSSLLTLPLRCPILFLRVRTRVHPYAATYFRVSSPKSALRAAESARTVGKTGEEEEVSASRVKYPLLEAGSRT